MENPHLSGSHEDGIIDEVLHLVQRLVRPHAPHIQLLTELVAMLVYGLTCLTAVVIGLKLLLFGLDSGGIYVLQPAHGHLCPHIAEDDGSLSAVDGLNLSYGRKALYPDGITGFHLAVRLPFPDGILQGFGGGLLPVRLLFQMLFVPFFAVLYSVDFLLEVLIRQQSAVFQFLFVVLSGPVSRT